MTQEIHHILSYVGIHGQTKLPSSRIHLKYSLLSTLMSADLTTVISQRNVHRLRNNTPWWGGLVLLCGVTDLSSTLKVFSSSLTLVSAREMTSSWTLELWRSSTSRRSSRSCGGTRDHFPICRFPQGPCVLQMLSPSSN